MESIQPFIPLIIVITAWFGAAVYFGRKVEKHKLSISEDSSRPINTITLIRGIEPTNYIRKYSVILNGKVKTYIKSGETIHIPISPGEHNIQVKIDWCKTKPYKVSLVEGQNVELYCGAAYNNFKCLFVLIFKPSSYIYVKSA